MLAYHVDRCTVKTARSRWCLQAGSMLLTTEARFMVTVEPERIVVWRLKDKVGAVAYRQYSDNQHQADDLQYDDHDFAYVHDDSVDKTPV